MNNGFLPVSRAEMEERGIKQFDFVYVIGDAYVDHPSFGHAIISRLLEAHGYSVGIISQPDWRDKESVCIFGEPRLGFLVSAGNMDSMVNHYSVSKKRRATDAFTPGGVMGKRPDYATIVYCNLLRQTYKHTPIIIGGIEASLRRLAHYDYWSNKMKRSILLDSGADLISYGMGEHSIVEIADALNSGLAVSDITFIDGTVYKTRKREDIYDAIELPHYEEVLADKAAYARSFYTQYCNTDPFVAKRLFENVRRKAFCRAESAGEAADTKRDGSGLCAAVSAYVSSELRSAGRGSCNRGSAFFPGQQPWLLRRMQFLCAYVPSGADYSGAQPRVHSGGGGEDRLGTGL